MKPVGSPAAAPARPDGSSWISSIAPHPAPPRLRTHLLALALLWAALLPAGAALVAFDARQPARSSDQMNIGLMVLKLQHPELFPRDPVFADTSLFRFYTPSFLALVEALERTTGSFDAALRALSLPLLLAFAAGMYVLLYQVTRSVPVSGAIAAASVLMQRSTGTELWGALGMRAVIPRTLFLVLLPWIVMAMLRWRRGAPAWLLPLLGLACGLAGNLHPVSGLCMLEILLLFALLSRRPDPASLRNVVFAAALAALGAAPIALNYLQGTEAGSDPRFSFATFRAEIQQEHNSFYPFNYTHATMAMLAVTWVISMAVWGAALWRTRRKEAGPASLFATGVLLQLPAVTLMTLVRAWPLVAAAAVYAGMRRSRRRADGLDWGILLFMIAVVFWGVVACWAFDWAWGRFAIWRLTSLVGEQGRVNRFLFLPLFLMAGRLAVDLSAGRGKAARLAIAVVMAVAMAWQGGVRQIKDLRREAEKAPQRAALIEAASWARATTPVDSLFYTNQLEFRLRSQRSITHCWKDTGLAYYARTRYMDLLKSFREMEAARGHPDELMRLARERRIGYIVLEGEERLDAPVAYRNDYFTVYATHTSSPPILRQPSR